MNAPPGTGRGDGAFGRFVAASGCANLADGIALVAWSWTASLLTRDPLLIAAVAAMLRLPWALAAIPAGIVTDRTDRRRLILRMDLARAGVFAAVAATLWAALPLPGPPAQGTAAPLAYAALLAAAGAVGLAEVFRDNAAQTMLPSIVPHARLERANGRLWSVELTANALAGPALGAWLLAMAVPAPFAANALAYVAGFALMLGLRGRFRPEQARARDWRRELAEAYAFLRGAPLLATLAWITGFWNLFFQMASIALVLHAQENLGLGPRAFGLILAAGALGGVLGGFLAERIVAKLGARRSAQWMLAACAPGFLAMGLAPGPWSLGAAFAVFEFAGIVWNTVSVTTRQRTIPDRLLGRVNSLYRLLAFGMMPVGLVGSGLIVRAAEQVAARETALVAPFVVAALGTAVLTAVGWRALARGFGAAGG